jgi:hypothetical protein
VSSFYGPQGPRGTPDQGSDTHRVSPDEWRHVDYIAQRHDQAISPTTNHRRQHHQDRYESRGVVGFR